MFQFRTQLISKWSLFVIIITYAGACLCLSLLMFETGICDWGHIEVWHPVEENPKFCG